MVTYCHPRSYRTLTESRVAWVYASRAHLKESLGSLPPVWLEWQDVTFHSSRSVVSRCFLYFCTKCFFLLSILCSLCFEVNIAFDAVVVKGFPDRDKSAF